MRKCFLLSLTILILSAIVVKSQSILAEFQIPSDKKIGDIQSFVIRDTIFLSVDISDPKFNVDGKKCYLISPDSNPHHFNTTLIGNSPVCGFLPYKHMYYLYYLSGKRKNITLKALSYSKVSGQQKIVDVEIEIDGTVVGSWQENDLSLVVYNKVSNQLKIIRINKMEVQCEKVFDLPVDLAQHYKQLTFIPEGNFTSVDRGAAKFKLYKIKNELVLTVDYTQVEMDATSKTTLIRMNIDNGEQTTKRFSVNTPNYFRSYVRNDKLYVSSISKKAFQLKISDLTTGELLGTKEMLRDTLFKEKFIYRRIGKDFRISQKETLYNMMKISSACLPSVIVTEEDSCTTSLIWGTYFNDKGIGSPGGGNPLASLVTMVVTTAIMQMGEGPGISRYFYLLNDCRGPYEFTESKRKSLRQNIDDYEISLDIKREFSDYKGYFDYQGGGIGVYQGHRDSKNKVTLIKFDRKKSDTSN